MTKIESQNPRQRASSVLIQASWLIGEFSERSQNQSVSSHSLSMSEGIPRDQRPTIKVILVGNSGVGKTCLIGSYLKNTFENRTAQTVAPAYSCREVQKADGTIVILQIWDTAGQERYATISQLFFRDSNVALLCFDPSDGTSVAAVKEWIKRILNEVSDCHLFGVLTKADLISAEELPNVLNETKAALLDCNLEQYFTTSSVTRDGVENVFLQAAELYTRKGGSTPAPLVPNDGEQKTCC
jgi:small GTP-binding protein